MTIIAIRNKNDIDVVFEDGSISYHKQYGSFKRGNIGHPNIRIQKELYIKLTTEWVSNTKGDKARVLEWRSHKDMDIVFEDGTILRSISHEVFRRGNFLHPDFKKKTADERGFVQMFTRYKRGAVDRGYEFNISFDDFSKVIRQPCHYCGSINSNHVNVSYRGEKEGVFFHYNGIDRVDNSLGYIDGNVVPCCKKCNVAKHDMGYDEFLSHIKSVYRHMGLG